MQHGSYYQYRFSINDTMSQIWNESEYAAMSAQYSKAAEMVDDRGGIVTLYRRLVTDASYLDEWQVDRTGWMVLKDGTAAGPWSIFAEVEVR